MRTTIGEVVVCVALLKQSREPVSERANLVRDFLGARFQELQKLDKRIFDRSQDAFFEGVGRPTFCEVPTEGQPIGELTFGCLIASLTTPADRSRIE